VEAQLVVGLFSVPVCYHPTLALLQVMNVLT
jgi:hypothetical protein